MQQRPPSIFERQDRRAAIALKKQKKLYSSKRVLRWGEKRRIILLRFGSLGNTETHPGSLSYRWIAAKLVIKHRTVVSVIRAYL